jgi:hypothetical protein
MLELFNLKKLKQINLADFSQGMIFNQEVDYQAKAAEFQALNNLTLEKVKDLSLNIEMLKSAISKHEKKVQKTQSTKKRVRRTKKELVLKFKVRIFIHFFFNKNPFWICFDQFLVPISRMFQRLCLRRKSPSSHQKQAQWWQEV